MLSFKLPTDKSINILCLGAHCDDIEIGAGGTLLKLLKENNIGKVKWVILASDEIRKIEAISSAEQILNDIPKEITVNSFRDGFMQSDFVRIKEYFEEIKKQFTPDLIFTHYRDDRHQDHRLVSDLTWNTWRNHLILEYEIPKYDGDMGTPNLYVALEEKYVAKRNRIIVDSFISQQNKHWFDVETFNALPRLRGMESATVFAEAFYARKVIL